jgi:uncharacterized membrane protein YkoI
MKINRFVALAAIVLLVVGAMGAVAARSFAQTPHPAAQVQATEAPDEGKTVAADTDDVEEQVGDQNTADTEAPDDEDTVAADTDDVEEQVGDQNEADTETGDNEQDAVPAGTPAITAEQAQATAEAYLNAGTATQVELDDENGQLVYSVEIGGTDVKVDAMTGTVLGTETGQD